jgi:photosystem II stability/assembly factor-like uncharacterized protein
MGVSTMNVKRVCSLIIVLLIVLTNLSYTQWIQTNGPAGRGGPVYTICFQNSDIFVDAAGIYFSKDNGNTWLKLKEPDGFPPSSLPSTIDVATNEENIFACYRGLYKSSDKGANWQLLIEPEEVRSYFTVVSVNKNWIVVGDQMGCFQSTDGGTSWAKLNIGVLSVSLSDSIGIIGSHNGIYASTNYGTTWDLSYNFYSYNACSEITDYKAYAGLYNFIITSNNGGVTWLPDSIVLSCNSVNTIAASPTESNFIFAGTDSGIFRSSDNGGNWITVNNGLNSKLILSLSFKTNGTGIPILYAGTGCGLYYSLDYGNSWTITGVPSGKRYLASSDQAIFVGGSSLYYEGSNKVDAHHTRYSPEVYYSTDKGNEWLRADEGLTSQNLWITSIAAKSNGMGGNNILASGFNRSTFINTLVRTTNNGVSWSNAFQGSQIPSVNSVAINSADIFVGATEGIFFSSNDGNIWEMSDSGITLPSFNNYYSKVSAKTFSFDDDKIYAAEGSNPLFGDQAILNRIIVSSDNGISWNRVDSLIPSGIINYSLYDTLSVLNSIYAKGAHIVVGTQAHNLSNTQYKPAGGGIYHYFYNGNRWIIADTSLSFKQVLTLTGKNSDVFAGTTKGVFHSSDYGSTWNDISDGLLDLCVTSLLINEEYLFAATSSGVWKRPLSEVTSVESDYRIADVPKDFYLAQNYPNPFNPTTTIFWHSPVGIWQTIKVYDRLGKEIVTLVDEYRPAGSYEVEFNASDLASGVYYYRLQAGEFVETKKLILLK